MMGPWVAAGIVFLLVLIPWTGAAGFSDEDRALQKGRSAAYELSETVRGKLQESMKSSGPAGAMKVCAYQAEALAEEVAARQGVAVRRTSLRLRNLKNFPDAWERALLERLQEMSLTGKVPDDVFEATEAGGKRVYRYAKTLLVGPVCIACHGTPSEIPEEVREVLGERYPEDQATGYRQGDLRGIVSVLIPAEE
ncbi:MAG TPA: DUF3365 domain-containing protein [Candidatus Deferrimicrobiaceae bacterium]